MKRPPLQFSHANGFPVGSYTALLHPLARRFRVRGIEAIGTDERYPVTERWPHLVEQLLDTIRIHWHGTPVVAVGHSLGAYLSFLAAVERPELFRCVVMLDAPIIGAVKGRLLGATKKIGIVDRVTPASATRDRRSSWPNREEAKAHFRSRKLFRDFSEACLDDYVSHGLVGSAGHLRLRLRLRIDPLIETHIYRTIPHDMSRHLARLKVPAGFIGGESSDVLRRVGMGSMRGARFVKRRVPGGHLFPFERPEETVAAIEAVVGELIGRS